MLNQCSFIGNVGKEPEIRAMNNGKDVASFSVAVTESWKDKQSGEWKDKTEWVNVVVFAEGLVSKIKANLGKGSKVYVQGKFQTRQWDDKDGVRRYSTEIVIQGFDGKLAVLDGKKEAVASNVVPEDECPF